MSLDSLRDHIDLVGRPLDLTEGVVSSYLSLISSSLKGVVSARHHGEAEVKSILMSAQKNFKQYMGQHRQDWSTVTWNTLFGYLTMPSQLGIDRADVSKMINDSETKQNVQSLMSSQKIEPLTAEEKTWGQSNLPIGGKTKSKNGAKRGELICTYFLELGSIKYIENKSNVANMDAADDSNQNNSRSDDNTNTNTHTNFRSQQSRQDNQSNDTLNSALSAIKAGLEKMNQGG